MTNLRGILAREIVGHGVIPFHRFMELALYCPNFGYYEREDKPPGRAGDFFTSVSVGPLFGELLAFQFSKWLEILAKPRQIMEAGAHDGALARDILRWLGQNQPETLASLEYWILEPSAVRRESQARTLAEFPGKVRWFEDWSDVPASGVHGVIFSNELLDALPVHRLGWNSPAQRWFEWGVCLKGESLAWQQIPVTGHLHPPELAEGLAAVLPDGFTIEICPAATDWWQKAAQCLRAGRLLTFDYGLDAEDFFSPARKNGTLRAYYRHGVTDDLLARPGEQDLTAQVNFSAVQAAGEAAGLSTEIFTTQGRFLTTLVEKMNREISGFEKRFAPRAREFQTLTHPEHLGQSFRALVQSRRGVAE